MSSSSEGHENEPYKEAVRDSYNPNSETDEENNSQVPPEIKSGNEPVKDDVNNRAKCCIIL